MEQRIEVAVAEIQAMEGPGCVFLADVTPDDMPAINAALAVQLGALRLTDAVLVSGDWKFWTRRPTAEEYF